VDGTATVIGLSDDGFAKRLRLELPDELAPYVVERGSIAIEGSASPSRD
jgi:riboflavin synthase alpha subunit